MTRHSITILLLALTGLFSLACSVGNEGQAFELEAIEPLTGPTSGGIQLTITGRFFTDSVQLFIGSHEAEILEVSSEQVTAVMPAMAQGGLYDLHVRQGSLEITYGERFNVRGDAFLFNRVVFPADQWPLLSGATPVFTDLDGDGDLDIVDPEDGTPVLFINDAGVLVPNGSGAYTGMAALVPLHLDGDAYMDFIQIVGGKPRAVFGGDLRLEPPVEMTLDDATASGILKIVPQAGDIGGIVFLRSSGSGKADLLTGSVETTDATPNLVTAATLLSDISTSSRILLFDANGDSHQDILVLDSETIMLFLGDGSFHFSPSPPGAFPAIIPTDGVPVALDLQGDGAMDLLFVSPTDTRLWLGRGDGTFADYTRERWPFSAAKLLGAQALDADRDGLTDVLVVTSTGAPMLLRYDATGWFFDFTDRIQPPLSSSAPLVLDLDGDSRMDIIELSGKSGLFTVYKNYDTIEDEDEDGILDRFDNCPATPNAAQNDSDQLAFGCDRFTSCDNGEGCTVTINRETRQAYLYCATTLTRPQAADFCAALGADLLTIDGTPENEFVSSFIPAAVWIDTTDASEEGVFTLPDGSPLEYANWADGEPNNANDDEDCVQLRTNGQWNDNNCGTLTAFVCEEPALRESDGGDACDNCPDVLNHGQSDEDGNGVGDACE